jgi:hypothetical protein
MGVPNSDVVYTSATTGRGDHKVHKGHVVALEKNIHIYFHIAFDNMLNDLQYLLGQEVLQRNKSIMFC